MITLITRSATLIARNIGLCALAIAVAYASATLARASQRIEIRLAAIEEATGASQSLTLEQVAMALPRRAVK